MRITEVELLTFIRDRLVNVYGESPNVDFVLSLNEVIEAARHRETVIETLPEFSGSGELVAIMDPLVDTPVLEVRRNEVDGAQLAQRSPDPDDQVDEVLAEMGYRRTTLWCITDYGNAVAAVVPS